MYLHKSGRLLLRSVDQESSEKAAFTFALPASYKSNVTTTAAADAPPEGAGAPSAAGGGDKSQQQQQQMDPAAGSDDDDGRRRLEALLPASWMQGRRERRWRRAATPQEEALGARVAALWRDGAGDEEERLLQVFEAVVNDAPPAAAAAAATSVKAGDMAEESEALGMTLLGEEAAAQGGEEHVAAGNGRVVASVVIPNRAKGQYIRQPSANGRGCVFTLDARTLPRLNSTQLAEAQRQQQEGDGGGKAAVGVGGDDDGVGDGLDDEGDGEGVETLAGGGRGAGGASAVDERLVFAEGLQGTLRSPECGLSLALESHEAVRLDWGKAYRKAVNYSIVVTLVCVLQIALLFRQLYFSRTQAAASRVSLLCIGQQAILDALLCIAHLLLCATLQPLFAAFASIAFFKLVIFSIFEIRYMFIIHQSRNSQSANAVRACLRAYESPLCPHNTSEWYTTPAHLPIFNNPPPPPPPQASFNGLRRQLASLHARFYAILFLLLFLIYVLANYLEVCAWRA